MKLMPMTTFIIESFKKWENDNNPDCQSSARYILGTHLYAKFLSQPLELWMFVPCDEKGNVLEDCDCLSDNGCCVKRNEYNKAKERVLFEGFITREIFNPSESFEVVNGLGQNQICIYKARPDYFVWNYKTVEDLCKLELTLTETALKTL